MQSNSTPSPTDAAATAAALSQVSSRARLRYAKDRTATVGITLGGIGVVGAVMLIFVYLLSVVIPLFAGADIDEMQPPSLAPESASVLHVAMEEQEEMGVQVLDNGELMFFRLASGEEVNRHTLPVALEHLAVVDGRRGELAGLSPEGELLRFRHRYRLEYPLDGGRIIVPVVERPYGDDPIALEPARALAVRDDDNRLTAVLSVGDGRELRLVSYSKSTSFFDDAVTLEQDADHRFPVTGAVDQLILDPLMNFVYAIDRARGQVSVFRLRLPAAPELVETVTVTTRASQATAVTLLAGGISLMVADGEGVISQWFPVRDADGVPKLQRIRDFAMPRRVPATHLIEEEGRRAFYALTAAGDIAGFHATAGSQTFAKRFAPRQTAAAAVSPRASRLLIAEQGGAAQLYAIDNEHPEMSFSALWGQVWYESYAEPEFTWQSSAANSDFEPKFSLAPLSFGTLKAAFYAMLFAVPLAIAGAIYTAYFMSPALRQSIKPTIEIMEALPTVILGFLAGLWLAPFIENYLPGVMLMLVFLVVAMPLAGFGWSRMPERTRHRVPEGWQPVLLVMPLIIAAMLALVLSGPIEALFFDGNMPQWLTNTAGITYDQRNSLVVGLAMGFAVIPTIFSIAEDAIFAVPKSLTQGSLALGATPWQTLTRVVLPTASPGIFSALMIGLGRAVGETMIVLMATGNTPIMDMNIFEGFRTLSANIAVEMPESEVGSTHFRLLFLAGLVLFMFTFVVNTLAEIVRQRLRMKYSNL
ncbi:MAG: ABC transporter permease subunit [Oceanococcaceae bacterium]